MRITENRPLKVVVIGAGAMANRVHYPSLASMPDVEIVGVCDLNTAALNETADKYRIRGRYSDYRQAITELKPDAVYVLGQPHQLYDVWVWCLEKGLNIFIEKPMGVNLHQAMNITHLAQVNNCITQVGFQRRNAAMVTEMLRKCRENGPVVHAVCTFTKQCEGPIMRAYDEMYDITIHAIDTLRAICGGEIVKIDSVAQRIRIPNFNAIYALLHFDNGATGLLMNNHISGRRTFSFEIHCPDICGIGELEGTGMLYSASKKSGQAYYEVAQGVAYDAMTMAGSKEYFIYGGYRAKHEEFIASIRSGNQPSSHFGDAVKTMQAGEVILAQALLQGADKFSKVSAV
jgi:virulence factor